MGQNESPQQRGEDAMPRTGMGSGATGQASVEEQPDQAEERVEPESMRGRLVMLRHDGQGQYSIWMRDRCIQTFCREFEEITGCGMPGNTQMQARIMIQQTGRLQHIDHVPSDDLPALAEEAVERVEVDLGDGVALHSMPHPTSHWADEALIHLHMELEQMQHTITMIESLRRR